MVKLKFGILGTGFIAEKFTDAAAVLGNELEIRAVASRTEKKAAEFAGIHGLSIRLMKEIRNYMRILLRSF